MKISNTAFLCGYFTAEGNPPAELGWIPAAMSEDGDSLLRSFYFPEFVDFHSKEVRKFYLTVDKEVSVQLRSGEELPFKVDQLLIWMMPSSMAVFAIKLFFNDKDINSVTEALSVLRNCCFYGGANIGCFKETAVSLLSKTYKALSGKVFTSSDSYAYLVEYGNKFKLFQIVSSPESPDNHEERDRLLYAVGTLSNYETSGTSAIDPKYYAKVMRDYRLGVFSSWTALALLDTVTFLGKDITPFQEGIWVDDYFGRIYIYELFRKCFLYHHNLLFRTGAKDPVLLQEEITSFERKYTFTAISYNFLPVEVDAAIVRGLDLKKEEETLSKIIAEEVAFREEESAVRRDRFLLFLTCLASMSAVWDISCLLDEIINYENTFRVTNWGYRLFSALLMIVIVVFAWRTTRDKRRNKI